MLVFLLHFFNQIFNTKITPTGSITIDKCFFGDISSTGHGGAIYGSSLSLNLARSTFIRTTSTGYAGAIHIATGDNTFIQCCSFSYFDNDYRHAGKCLCILISGSFFFNGSTINNPQTQYGYEMICDLALHLQLVSNNLSSNINQNRAGIITAHDILSPNIFNLEYSIFINNSGPYMIYVADLPTTIKTINRIVITRCQDSIAFNFRYPTLISNSNIVHPENKLGLNYTLDNSCETNNEIINFVPLKRISDYNCLLMQLITHDTKRSGINIIPNIVLLFLVVRND